MSSSSTDSEDVFDRSPPPSPRAQQQQKTETKEPEEELHLMTQKSKVTTDTETGEELHKRYEWNNINGQAKKTRSAAVVDPKTGATSGKKPSAVDQFRKHEFKESESNYTLVSGNKKYTLTKEERVVDGKRETKRRAFVVDLASADQKPQDLPEDEVLGLMKEALRKQPKEALLLPDTSSSEEEDEET